MSFFATQRARLALALFATCGVVYGNTAFAQQKAADNSILSIERNSVDNTPAIITFSPSAGWKAGQEQEVFTKYLGVDASKVKMIQSYSTTTPSKVTTARYYQYYKGIKAEYGSFTVTIKNSVINFISGNYYNTTTDVSAIPVISESTAFTKALQLVGATKYMWQDPSMEALIKARYHKADTSYMPHGILTWIEDYTNGVGDRKMHLAYSFDVYAQEPMSRQKVFVDATDGHILHSNSMIKHTATTGGSKYSRIVPIITSKVGTNYVLYDSTRGNGVHTLNMHNGTNYASATEFTSASNSWPIATADSPAIDAHWAGEKVYDYWLTQQGRLSWDNLDGILLQYVHYDVNFDNAYWDGTEMTYGDGSGVASGGFSPLTSLDVTAHEIGHGVCEATANLVYASESGAMNEGLSDCWGATIENFANPFEVDAVAKQVWKIGEEIGGGAPLRSMDFPHNESNPDTYGTNDPYWVNVTGCTPGGGNDQCGVHTNSGVTNKWYYLVVMGGIGTNANGNGYNVNAIGWTSAATILYQTELALGSNATYANFRTTSVATATTLFGACSPEVQSVTNAWYAVGVGAAFVACTPQIGFVTTSLSTTEYAATTTCPASRVINIGLKPTGPAITGGNPVVTIVAAPYSTAVAGVDYTITGSPITFIASDTSTRYATLTIFDNGAVNDNKNLTLGFTLATMGSTATVSPTGDSMRIAIYNNDSNVLSGGVEYHTLNTGTAVTCNLTSAFPGANRRSRTQWILTAAEMTAAGVRPGVAISQIGFTLTSKSSTTPFVGYAINMANTTSTDVGSAFVSAGLVNVIPAFNHTTNLGLDTIGFTTNFIWDGTSNVMVQACYGQNASNFGANDQMMGIQGGANICAHNQSTGTGTTGCSLGWSGTGSNLSNARPVMRFKQVVPPSKIATVLGSNRTWTVTAGTKVHFWNASDTSLVATTNNETANLGCVSANITAAGVGFTPSAFSAGTNRSVKEVTINPTINGATTTYDATIYLTTTELNGVAPATLFLVKTEQPTDATVSSANSVLLTPTLTAGTNYTAFKGTFTGLANSRFFLTDGPLCASPSTTITASGPTTFCLGSSVTLSTTTGAGYTYQWQKGAVNIPGATTSSYAPTHGGSYQVQITSGGCTGTSLATAVSVDSAYTAPIAGASTTVCSGQSITLTDITPSGTWASGSTGVATVTASGMVTGVAGGVATISYTTINLCGSATATLSVTVNASPVVAGITGTLTACAGSLTTLSDATPLGNWSSSNTGIATVSATGTVGGGSAGSATISYTVNNAAGCITNQVATVTIFATPTATITASGTTTFCSSSSVTLIANTGAGLSYQWQESGVNIPGATNSTYNTNLTGNYTVIITNLNNCSATSNMIPVTVTTGFIVVPSVSLAASPGTTLCVVSSMVTFTPTSVNGGSAPVYNWYVNGSAISTGSTFSYTPSNGDQVQVLLTSNAACVVPDTASATLVMTIMTPATPGVVINALPNDTVCAGTMATFVGIPTFGGTTPSYLWNKNGVNVATGPAYNYVPTNGDVLLCRMTSNYFCRLVDTAWSTPLTITVDSNVTNTITVTADHTVAAPGTPVTFTATAPHAGAGAVYQWYINGAPVVGVTSSTYTTTTLTAADVVTCRVTSTLICASPGTAISGGVTVNVTNGVADLSSGNKFLLMPNPNNGTFTIKGTLVTSDDELAIKVTNMLGQTVYTNNVAVVNGNVNTTISLNQSLAAGVYMVNITSAGANAVFHVVVNK